jgi:glycosyltransferase 2 family protein
VSDAGVPEESSSKKLAFRWLLAALKWVIALSLVGWLVYQNRDQFERLKTESVRWEFLVAAFALCGASIVLTFVRWYLLVWAQQFPFTVKDALRLGFLGYLFNYVAPGAIGGDFVKAVLMAREQKSRRTVAVATILLDRILGLLGLLMVGALAAVFVAEEIQYRDRIITVLWGGTLAGLLGLLVMLHPATPRARWLQWLTGLPKAGPLIGDAASSIALYQTHRTVVVMTVLLSVVGHFGMISSFYFCACAVVGSGTAPDYVTHLLLIPLAEIIGVIVPVPGGIGALEGAVQESYKLAGADPGIGLLVAGAYRVTTILIAAVGSVYYLSARRQIRALMAEAETTN